MQMNISSSISSPVSPIFEGGGGGGGGNGKWRPCAVPSDAASGNVLEAINTTLNHMDKHYIDRDLQRTGNSIVMISAGNGFFKVDRQIAHITKQRMMDCGIGMDFISLSHPPLHTVPLFLLARSRKSAVQDSFYEVPYWMNVTYIDCPIDSSATVANVNALSAHDIFKSSSVSKVRSSFDIVKDIQEDPYWTGLTFEEGVGNGNSNGVGDSGSDSSGDVRAQRVWGAGFRPLPFPSMISGHMMSSVITNTNSTSVTSPYVAALPSPLKIWLITFRASARMAPVTTRPAPAPVD
eukprot:gene38341-50328_t